MNYNATHLRQAGAIAPDLLDRPIVLIGAGSIGSMIAFNLAKIGFNDITVYDNDLVSTHNVGNQLFGLSSVGQTKVEALYHIIKGLTGVSIKPVKERFKEKPFGFDQIFISAVDSMRAREEIYAALKGTVTYIDTRVGFTTFEIIGWDLMEHPNYHSRLGLKEAELPCMARGIYHTASFVGAITAQVVLDFAQKKRSQIHLLGDLQHYSIINLQEDEERI